MTRIKHTATRYAAWGFAFALCGSLFGLKTVETSPGDIWSGLFMGAGLGFVVAGCIDIAAGMIALHLPRSNEHPTSKSKALLAVATIALFVIAICAWLYVANRLLHSVR